MSAITRHELTDFTRDGHINASLIQYNKIILDPAKYGFFDKIPKTVEIEQLYYDSNNFGGTSGFTDASLGLPFDENKNPTMVLYDAVGAEFYVENKELPNGSYSIVDYVNTWNNAFSTHSNPDVQTASFSYVKKQYETTTVTSETPDGFTLPYRGFERFYYIITISSTADLYVKWATVPQTSASIDDRYLNSIAVCFPYVHYETIRDWRYSGLLHPAVNRRIAFNIKDTHNFLVMHHTDTYIKLVGDLSPRDEVMELNKPVNLNPGSYELAFRWLPSQITAKEADLTDEDKRNDLFGLISPYKRVVFKVTWDSPASPLEEIVNYSLTNNNIAKLDSISPTISVKHPDSKWEVESIEITKAVCPKFDVLDMPFWKNPVIGILDSNGTKFNVAVPNLTGSFSIQEYVDAMNTAFLANANIDVRSVSFSLTRYTASYDRSTNELEGYENYQPGFNYSAGARWYYVLRLSATRNVWVWRYATNNYVERCFPFLPKSTVQRYYSSTATHNTSGINMIWQTSLKSQKRYFLIDNDKWRNSYIKINTLETIFWNTGEDTVMVNTTKLTDVGDGDVTNVNYVDDKHKFEINSLPVVLKLPKGVDKIKLDWLPSNVKDDPDDVQNLLTRYSPSFTLFYRVKYKIKPLHI